MKCTRNESSKILRKPLEYSCFLLSLCKQTLVWLLKSLKKNERNYQQFWHKCCCIFATASFILPFLNSLKLLHLRENSFSVCQWKQSPQWSLQLGSKNSTDHYVWIEQDGPDIFFLILLEPVMKHTNSVSKICNNTHKIWTLCTVQSMWDQTYVNWPGAWNMCEPSGKGFWSKRQLRLQVPQVKNKNR